MHISTVYRNQWLRAADLAGKCQEFTIADVAEEELGEEKEVRAVLRFKETPYGFVLNRTNAEAIASRYGDETNDWLGQPIWLHPEKTTFGGKTVDCVRARFPKTAQAAVTARAITPPTEPASEPDQDWV